MNDVVPELFPATESTFIFFEFWLVHYDVRLSRLVKASLWFWFYDLWYSIEICSEQKEKNIYIYLYIYTHKRNRWLGIIKVSCWKNPCIIYSTDPHFPSPCTERRDRPQIRTRRKTFGSLNADDGKYCYWLHRVFTSSTFWEKMTTLVRIKGEFGGGGVGGLSNSLNFNSLCQKLVKM